MSRRELYRLIRALPERQIPAAKKHLESFVGADRNDAIRHALEAAPIDDEPLTCDERRAIEEAEEDIKAGRVRIWNPKTDVWS